MLKPIQTTRFVIWCFVSIMVATTLAYSQGKLITDTIVSPALQNNNLGDPATRKTSIYLPPSYENGGKYPVVYILTSIGDETKAGWDNRIPFSTPTWVELIGTFNRLIGEGKMKEMLLVMPNTQTKYGGSWFVNSALQGNYEDYITKELLNFVENKYRVLRHRNSRALAGLFTAGGYGAMTLAMKHPDLFSIALSYSGVLSWDVGVKGGFYQSVIAENPDGMKFPENIYDPKKAFTAMLYAIHAAITPNLNNPPDFIDLPFEYPSGKIIDAVYQKSMKFDATTMVDSHQDELRSLRGIYLEVSSSDPDGLTQQARAFHETLDSYGIPHRYETFDGDRHEKFAERLPILLQYLSSILESEGVTAIAPQNKLATTWGRLKAR